MLHSIEGVYHDGKIELLEAPPEGLAGRVVVTFLESGPVDLFQRGVDENQATDLRRRLSTFVEDWDRPEMDVYDAV